MKTRLINHALKHLTLRTHIACLSIGSLCASPMDASVNINEGVPIEIRGIMAYQGQYQFSVYNEQTRASSWVAINQSFAGIQIHAYDPQNMKIHASYGGQEVTLSLARHSQRPNIIQIYREEELEENSLPSISSKAEIPALVAAYEEAQLETLPEATHPLYELLKQTTANRVQSYKGELEASLNPKPEATASELSARIRSQRGRNNVNSRPWASDHIELHGAPE